MMVFMVVNFFYSPSLTAKTSVSANLKNIYLIFEIIFTITILILSINCYKIMNNINRKWEEQYKDSFPEHESNTTLGA